MLLLEEILKQKIKNFDSSYYNKIATWRSMWQGKSDYLKDTFYNGVEYVERTRYSLNMPKKVAEDWASIFSENNQVTFRHKNGTDLGEKEEELLRNYLDDTNYWGNLNEQLELGFALGTAACLVRANILIDENGNALDISAQNIRLDYVTAQNIFPLTIENGNIVECIFGSEKLINGKKYALVETHKKNETGGYTITNELYNEDKIAIDPAVLNLPASYSVPFKLFHIFKPNILNNIDNNNGLGLSIYHNAYDNFTGVDFAFDIFLSDLKNGKKLTFLSTELLGIDENGNYIAPQDANKELFKYLPTNEDKGDLIHEFNPELRITDDEAAVQKQLDYLSFKVGFGTKHYQFNAGSIVTATQYVGDKQEMLKYIKKHFNNYKSFVEGTLDSIFSLLNLDIEAIIPFEDTIIMDDEAMKATDLMLVNAGIMQKWEYRVKWFNETEEEAKEKAVSDLVEY